jgi:hypothetical protein
MVTPKKRMTDGPIRFVRETEEATMRYLLFILGLLFRRRERVHGETDFLGFEAFTARPNGKNDGSTTASSPDKAIRKVD